MTRPSLRLSLALVGFCALFALPALADSQVRIVRLSDVHGAVQIDKGTGAGFENAFANLPITQATQLRTRDNGRAEIEFEDGSSMRLAPNTAVEFSKLSLSDSGKRISQVNLIEGMAYVNWLGKDDFAMSFSHENVALDHSAHFRVDTSDQVANLAVFKGQVDVEGPAGKVTVEKKQDATFNAADQDKYTVAKKIPEAPLDSWDKEAISYHDQYAKNNSTPYGYGFSDLNYYGSFMNVPGYGMLWQPYFTGAGWDPFMDGAWGFYPGFGYMFVSAYPWGWMPYRYGNWMFVPSMGWMWQPGAWNTWVTVPRYSAAAGTHVTALTPPATGTMRTVAVGRGSAMTAMQPSRMTVNAGSAGLGIARGSVNNLGHLNHQVAKSGFAQVQPAPQFSRGRVNSEPRYSPGGGQSRGSVAPAPAPRAASPAPSASRPSGGGSHHQ
jgi:hypothetical protein